MLKATQFDSIFVIVTVHTNPHFPDSIQAYYAGLMEGVITRKLIRDHYHNTIGDYCQEKSTYCDRLKTFLEENVSYMNEKGKKKIGIIIMSNVVVNSTL